MTYLWFALKRQSVIALKARTDMELFRDWKAIYVSIRLIFFPSLKVKKKKKGSKLLRQKEIAIVDEDRLTKTCTQTNFG